MKIGVTAPPVETEAGWLLIYHGVSKGEHRYRVKAALLDINDPMNVIARLHEPIFEPEMPYEREGEIPNVVFPCGAVIIKDRLFIYYGGADKVIGVASIKTSQLLKALLSEEPSKKKR